MTDTKLKKHVLSLINDQMDVHIVKEIISMNIDKDNSNWVIFECKMANDKIKKCSIEGKIINQIQQLSIKWI